MTLRTVKPENPKPPRMRRHQLTDPEVKRIRATTKNLIRPYGSVRCLSGDHRARLGCPGMASAIKIGRVTGVPIEKLLSGRLTKAGACPTCSAPVRRVA